MTTLATSVLLLGKTGSGKSSLGNALLGKQAFSVSSGMLSSGSRVCAAVTSDARDLTVVDTPDILEFLTDPEALRKAMSKAFDLANNAFHVVLIHIRLDVRFTAEERSVLEILEKLFQHKVYQFSIVVFTHCDALLSGNQRIHELLGRFRSEMPRFDQLLRSCGERYLLVGKEKNDEAMKRLRELMDSLRHKNEAQAYTKSDFDKEAGSHQKGKSSNVCHLL